MLQLEEASLEQDRKMTEVLDRMLQQMAVQPAQMLTPVAEQGRPGYQTPVSIGKPQGEGQLVRAAQTLSAPATPTVREQMLEAALKELLDHGDSSEGEGSVRHYLASKGHSQVAGMFSTECREHSEAI